MTTVLFLGDQNQTARVYGMGRRERIESIASVLPGVLGKADLASRAQDVADVEAVFSTWGMPALDAADLERLPKLKAVFYAAGSVKSFARPLLERGVLVSSAWKANAVPVAEFALAQILLSAKGYFANTRSASSPGGWASGKSPAGRGNYGAAVGLIGFGQIARRLAALLKNFQLEVIAHDPFLSDADAEALGVRKVSLEQLFSEAYVVSNHLPDLPPLRGLLNRPLFERMPRGATFVNTARGAEVAEADLIAVLRERPDLTALLDVTHPEPPSMDSELCRLPNVRLSSHIAGSLGDEVVRMADFMIDEFTAWEAGRPLSHSVALSMLETMA